MGMNMDGKKRARNGHERGMSKMQPCMAMRGHAWPCVAMQKW